jgi:hypothetical protein
VLNATPLPFYPWERDTVFIAYEAEWVSRSVRKVSKNFKANGLPNPVILAHTTLSRPPWLRESQNITLYVTFITSYLLKVSVVSPMIWKYVDYFRKQGCIISESIRVLVYFYMCG